jgi:L-lactate dehydrogenase
MANSQSRKIVIVGAGAVGVTYAYALMQTSLAEEIVFIDLDRERVAGEVMDLSHGLPFVPPVAIRGGDYSDCRDAGLIVVTAGAKQRSGQSRLELIQKNAEIAGSICDDINQYPSEAVLVMVTNPVDALTYVALQRLGWSRNRILGSGTVLDSSRFRYLLSQHCGVDPRSVHAYIIGEHGDSEVAAWSLAHIGGVPIQNYCPTCHRCAFKETHRSIVEEVRKSAYHIIDYKGATFYAIGLSLVRISEAILRNERSVLTVSTYLNGEYGQKDICLSVPSVVGRNGVEMIVNAELADEEQKELDASAKILRGMLDQLKI